MMQSVTVRQILSRHGWTDGMKREPNICTCDHKLQGSNAVFFQSIGLLFCNGCEGWQMIRKPVN